MGAGGGRDADSAGIELTTTMRILSFFRSLWLKLARRRRAERALDDEIRAYVDLLAAEYERVGMTPGDARRRVLVETGGVEQVKEATRAAWVGEGIATFARERRRRSMAGGTQVRTV